MIVFSFSTGGSSITGGSTGSSGGHYILGVNEPQSILNYLYLPAFSEASKKEFDVSAFPLLAYQKIFNDWFRSENLADEVPIYTSDGYMPISYYNSYSAYLVNTFGLSSISYNHSNSLPYVNIISSIILLVFIIL